MRSVSESVLELNEAEVVFEEPASLLAGAESNQPVSRTEAASHVIPGIVVGKLIGFEETGAALVTFLENTIRRTIPARATVALSVDQIDHEVALAFEHGDLTKPIILGCIHPISPVKREGNVDVSLDSDRMVLSAEREIILRCGKSSITLTRAGKIIIRGAYLLSRSSGVNRIKGGSVQIN
jgi:Domain of unknown function (DUF6484)